MQTGLDKAISAAGSAARLADALGVTPQVISNWAARGIPVERCLDIEQATGVSCEDLRPDKRAFFEGLRGTKPGNPAPAAEAA